MLNLIDQFLVPKSVGAHWPWLHNLVQLSLSALQGMPPKYLTFNKSKFLYCFRFNLVVSNCRKIGMSWSLESNRLSSRCLVRRIINAGVLCSDRTELNCLDLKYIVVSFHSSVKHVGLGLLQKENARHVIIG